MYIQCIYIYMFNLCIHLAKLTELVFEHAISLLVLELKKNLPSVGVYVLVNSNLLV